MKNEQEKMQGVNDLASALGATVEVIQKGGDMSTWFCVNRMEWVEQIRSRPDKYAGINAWEAYARHHFNRYFAAEVHRTDPDAKLGKIPAYAGVFDWLLGNHGKGLFMLGMTGTGKTAIARAIRALFADGHGMWFYNERNAYYAERKMFQWYQSTDLRNYEVLDTALSYRFVIVDDLGMEQETAISYGQRRNPIIELIDNAERRNGLLILTSNLTSEEFLAKYGERTVDRLNRLCKTILFKGNSFRA